MTVALQRLLSRTWFRLLVAAFLVAWQVHSVKSFASEHFDNEPFDSAPDHPPAFQDPLHQPKAPFAKRLIVSRWDGEHYISIALRGYTQCPTPPMTPDVIRRSDPHCTLGFFPGYSMIGRMVVWLTKAPMDYALWYVSLLASFLAFFFWTSPTITKRLGLAPTWIALAALNAFPEACYFVFIMTEPCSFFFTFGSYVAFARRRFLLSALLAGAASAMRITGVAASIAFTFALAFETLRRRPRVHVIAWRLVLMALSAWGILAIMAYFWYRFDDPRLYQHAHEVMYGDSTKLESLLHPKTEWLVHSLDDPLHDGVWVGALLLLFALGHRLAFRKFPISEQVLLYTVVAATLGIAYVGSVSRHLEMTSRYALLAFPLFMAIGAVMNRKWLPLVLWLIVCRWHSVEVDTCYYVADVGPQGLRKCNMTQWLDR